MQIERPYLNGTITQQLKKWLDDSMGRLQAYERLLPIFESLVGKRINARISSSLPSDVYYMKGRYEGSLAMLRTHYGENSQAAIEVDLGKVNEVVTSACVEECKQIIKAVELAVSRAKFAVDCSEAIVGHARRVKEILNLLRDQYDVSFARDFNFVYEDLA